MLYLQLMQKSIKTLTQEDITNFKEKINIKARPYNGKLLDIEILESSGVLPMYQIQAGDERNIYVSKPYKKGGYVAFVGYVQDEDKLIARTFFYSRSEGIARLLRRYKFKEVINEEGEKKDKVTWNDKGYSEKSIALPIPLQKGLAEILSLYTDIDKLDVLGGNIFYGTAFDLSKEDDDYAKEVSKESIRLQGNFYGATKKDIVPPNEMIFTDTADSPDFDNLIDSYSIYLEYYGMSQVHTYKSKNNLYTYLFNTDEKGRTWIGQVDNESKITSLGIRSKWVDSGCLTTPAWEYLIDDIDQTGGYGDETNRFKSYVDMYKNYISQIPVVKEYLMRVS